MYDDTSNTMEKITVLCEFSWQLVLTKQSSKYMIHRNKLQFYVRCYVNYANCKRQML